MADLLRVFDGTGGERFAAATKVLVPPAKLWPAWPEEASGRHLDLGRREVRAHALARGWVDDKAASISAVWSGILFAKKRSRGPVSAPGTAFPDAPCAPEGALQNGARSPSRPTNPIRGARAMCGENNATKMSIMLTCKDVSASLAYYRDKLGFQVDSTWPSEDAPQWASVSHGGQTFMLGGEVPGGNDDPHHTFYAESTEAFHSAPGGGMIVYVQVPEVDAYHAQCVERGASVAADPRDEFYGLRNFPAKDLDGYRIYFFTPIVMESCQSCGVPMSDTHPGQTYCHHCADAAGNLKPFEEVFEGTVAGYFMGIQGMEREAAEAAAKEHLAKMPAWHCHS